MAKQKRSSRRMGYVFALAAGAVVESISTLGAPLHWVYEAVDPEKTARGHGAALDAQDGAHVVYGQDALYYDWEDADGWHGEMADATSAQYSISVALDPAGRLHVVYVDQLTYHVKYARRDQGGWFVETIAEDASRNNGFAVMCLDHAGWPHVGYQSGDYQARQLKHVSKDTSGWQATTVGSWSSVNLRNPTIRVADDGQPHLGCQVRQGPPPVVSPSIFHAWREPTGWQGAEISGLGAHKLQFDAAGRLHVASENSIYNAVYALIIGDTAFIEELPSKVAPADPDLAVDDLNQPHIAYAANQDQIRYVRKDATSWHFSTVDAGNIGDFQEAYPSLCLAPDGTPHITYRHNRYGTGEDISRYAWLSAGRWERIDLERGGAISSLVIDPQGRPHIAYCNWAGRRNLSCLYVPSLALTGLAPLPGGQVRLDWQGALEGAGIDGAPSLHGPWSSVAADLGRSQGDVAADPSLHFFQLRQTPPPQPSNRSQQRNMPKVARM